MLFEHILNELPDALADASAPHVSILLVVDDDDFSLGTEHDYRTTILQKTLRDAGYAVELLRRKAGDASTALDSARLAGHQQLWFFLRSTNTADELTQPEIDALWDWMDGGGGVLITGDHADCTKQFDGGVIKATAIKGLGGPIGRLIPRAGHLRVWDAFPGAERPFDSNDSTTTGASADETDGTPQRLLVPHPAHEIFNNGAYYLPDHPHEGLVKNDVTIDQWFRTVPNPPPAFQPPRIIAHGIDWWRGRTFALMAAWDGDGVGDGLGRVLADASWHHYVDYNLARLEEPGRARVLRLYVNQAEYLSPRKRRAAAIARALVGVLRTPAAVEYELTDPRGFGEFVEKQLARSLSGTLLEELRDGLREGITSRAIDLASLRDTGVETHLLGVQVGHLRRAITDGKANDLKALRSEVLGVQVLRDALNNYELELELKAAGLKHLRSTIG